MPVVLLLLLGAGCDMPKDPEGTWQRVRGGTLRLGISTNPPWTVRRDDGRASGIEMQLLGDFARTLDARIEFHWGAESHLIELVRDGRLDVAIGGLKESSPWSKEVGSTRPYAKVADEKYVMFVRQGENRWLLELDRFLQTRRSEVVRVLSSAVSDSAPLP